MLRGILNFRKLIHAIFLNSPESRRVGCDWKLNHGNNLPKCLSIKINFALVFISGRASFEGVDVKMMLIEGSNGILMGKFVMRWSFGCGARIWLKLETMKSPGRWTWVWVDFVDVYIKLPCSWPKLLQTFPSEHPSHHSQIHPPRHPSIIIFSRGNLITARLFFQLQIAR